MGRHGRPERVRRAQMTAFRAAAAVGVAGTLAFAVQSVGKDVVVQAQSDSPYEPAHDAPDAGTAQHHDGSQAKTPGSHNGMATSFSAAPKVLQPVKHVTSAAKSSVGGTIAGNSIPQPSVGSTTPQQPVAPVQGSGSGSGSTTQQQPPPQQQPPADDGGSSQSSGSGGSSSTGSSSTQSGGSLGGVVGGLVGGVTGTLGGLLGG
jgi:uncharacterized membrane protein YgcG